MSRFDVRCLSAALIEGGQVCERRLRPVQGRSADPVTADTVFAVASLSKPPFAHLVLRLCDRGLLDLDTPLAELYREPYSAFGLDPHAPELRRITARQVLSHTSGLGNMQADDGGRILFSPGSCWHYSGEGYLYLQAVVEHVVGSPLERIAAAEVFEPLGMTSTSYLWRPDGNSSTPGPRVQESLRSVQPAHDCERLRALRRPHDAIGDRRDNAGAAGRGRRVDRVGPRLGTRRRRLLALGRDAGLRVRRRRLARRRPRARLPREQRATP